MAKAKATETATETDLSNKSIEQLVSMFSKSKKTIKTLSEQLEAEEEAQRKVRKLLAKQLEVATGSGEKRVRRTKVKILSARKKLYEALKKKRKEVNRKTWLKAAAVVDSKGDIDWLKDEGYVARGTTGWKITRKKWTA